jgi:enoyl-CoA hydratase/carnithine racemase
MSDYKNITYEKEDKIGIITLNRPDKMNALSKELLAEFMDILEKADADENTRVLIITGAGRAFCAGYDQSASNTGERNFSDDWRKGIFGNARFWFKIWDLTIPVIAAVNGFALAGGGDLAMACDITLASDQARFGYPAIRMSGFPPTLLWPYLIGPKFTKELLFTGKQIDAAEAERMGMVNRVVSHEKLLDEAMEMAREMLKTPRLVLEMNKVTVNRVFEMMGMRAAMGFMGEMDVIAHMTKGGEIFGNIAGEKGAKEAFKWMNTAEKD